jgi:Big-like domain-containing protein
MLLAAIPCALTLGAMSCAGEGSTTLPAAPAAVASVTISALASSLRVGESLQLSATARDIGGVPLAGRTITWSSSSPLVATVSTSGLVVGVAPGAVTISAASDGRTGNIDLTVLSPPSVSTRAEADRTDEASGSQIHLVYLLPSDGVDRGLDTTGTLVNSIGAAQTWLAGQTSGRRLRFDTYDGGKLDITFRRLSRSNAALQSYGLFIRDTIEKDLAAGGFTSTTKIYAVYYDGGATNTCGGGAWPPQLNGRVAAMYLRGTFTNSAPACDTNPFASSPTAPPGYMEYAMIHEILHTMGIVSPSAPNHTLNGHVDTDPTDLMYAGSLPWRPSALDVNRRNYFSLAGLPAGIYDFAASPFLVP